MVIEMAASFSYRLHSSLGPFEICFILQTKLVLLYLALDIHICNFLWLESTSCSLPGWYLIQLLKLDLDIPFSKGEKKNSPDPSSLVKFSFNI